MNMRVLYRSLHLGILLLSAFFAFGQQSGQFITASQSPEIPFTIVHYDTKHGLPQNQVIDIAVRRNGSLILSTANGIVEYNGSQFISFIHRGNYKKQMQSRIHWHEASGQLFGSELTGSFHLIYPDFRFIRPFMAADVSGDRIIGIDTEGKIWRGDIYGKSFRLLGKTDIVAAIDLLADETGCYIAGEKRLVRFDFATGKAKTLVAAPVSRIRRNMHNGRLYFTSSLSPDVYEIDRRGEIRSYSLSGFLPADVQLTDIAFTDSVTTYITSSAGLLEMGPGGTRLYGQNNDLPTRQLQCLYYDSTERCLFVGTGLNGLLKLTLKSCISYFDPDNLGSTSVTSMVRSKDGTLLTAGYRGTIFGMANGEIFRYYQGEPHIASMTEIDGTVYAGTWGKGIILLRNGNEIGRITPAMLPGGSVYSISRDSRGKLWIGTNHGIAAGSSPENIRPLLTDLIRNNVNEIYELRNGNLCIASVEEIFIITPSGKLVKRIDRKDGLVCKEVRAFYEDRQGKLWIGTYDGGLYCYDQGKLRSINGMPNCALHADVFTLLRDNGNILITSNMGLWAVSERKLNDFYNGSLPYLVPFYFGEESGIRNTEFNGGKQNCFVRNSDGSFFFPTIQGIVLKKAGMPRYRKLHPRLQAIYLNDTLTDRNTRVFPRSTRSIVFRFFCASFNRSYNVHYQYKLTGPGLDGEWSSLSQSGSVSLAFLRPGDYTLNLRAVDAFNDKTPETLTYSFTVEPYFYEAVWFRLLVISLVLLTVAFFMRSRYLRIIEKKNSENAIGNTILELKLKAIQSKMDPHFIFNALNNIIYLLDSQKYREAEVLLQDFSLLIRRFLEHSDFTFLSLGEELDIIDLYLSIEQKRYNGGFDYLIRCDENARGALIPTLLIQPLVENAVKHGVSHTNRKCHITVSAQLADGVLQLTVEDDGIGREKSGMINMGRKKHISKGLGLVEDKIQIMRQKYDLDIKFAITDIREKDRTGTVARLVIPVYDKVPDS